MTIDKLLIELRIRDLQLRRNGSDLILRGNNEALEPSLVSELRAHKGALLGMISDGENWWSPPVTITPEMLPLVRLTGEEIERIVATVPGGAANVQDIYPLAPLQEGILFHHLMSGGKADPYLRPSLYSFDTRERVESYLKAMQAVIDRHDILRTGVVWEGLSEAVQVVWRKAVLPVEEVDLGEGTGDGAERLYERFNPRSHRMDLRQAPLLRVVIAQDEEKERWLMLMLRHHLAGDHTALEVMQEEIQAYLQGKEEELAEPLPFRNLVAQARLGGKGEEQEEYFRKLLGDVEEPTAPFGMLDVRRDGRGIEEGKLKVEEELGRRMKERARKLGVSVASLCHVAWAQVLAKVSGREDVVFGSVLLGRMQGGEGADRVMGLFINTLPVRMRVGEEGVEASVREMHRQLAELLRHEHASLALAQRCSGVPAPQPLFTSLLNYRHSGGEKKAGGEGRGEKRRVWEGVRGLYGEERSNYPLILSVDDLGEGFGLTVQVEKTIAAKRVCGYMHTALGSLVEALEKKPSTAMWRLPVLPAEERQQVLYEWNERKREFSEERCVQELFEEQVERAGGAIAVVYEGQEMSYGEVNGRANQLARYLREIGVRGEARVAICMERSAEMIVALLGVLKAGGAYVPLDPGNPEERLRYMVEDSAAVVVLTQGQYVGMFAEFSAGLAVVDVEEERGAWQELEESNLEREEGARSNRLAYVIYTSGSTGKPKGVMVDHRGLANYIRHAVRSYLPERVVGGVVSTPLSFDATITTLLTPLVAGKRVELLPEDEAMISRLAERLFGRRREGDEQAWLFKMTPAHLDALEHVKRKEEEGRGRHVVVIGGEQLAAERLRTWKRDLLPKAEFVNEYGPTEAVVGCSVWELTDEERLKELEEQVAVPIGNPIGNARIYILDGHGEPVPVGVVGEIYIGGAGMARGYLKREELTAERFVPDPYIEEGEEGGRRMYQTGDLGRWCGDGNIEFVGRNDFQVKVRGFRIELGEIEARLREHPGVREAVVIAREDTSQEKRLVAYYTGRGADGSVGVEELRAHLSAGLPEYMVPAAYAVMKALPLTRNGKVDRRALPAPESDAYEVGRYEPPRGETESWLAKTWAEILELERVGRHDDFFALGGHSLLVIRVLARLQQDLGVQIEIGDVFDHPKLADLAQVVERTVKSELPRITRADRSRGLPLSYAQQRLWFLTQMGEVSEAYHIPVGIRLKGRLDRKVLRRSLNRIVERHEALRTTFALEAEGAVQRIGAVEESNFYLVEEDIREVGERELEGELERRMKEEAGASFHLEAGPLIRGRLLQLGEEEHVLLITMHHIVSDGWSLGLLIKELSALYRAYLRGEQDPLLELEIQYGDYAVWQRRWMEGEVLRQQGEYWKRELAGAPVLLELPTDRARPLEQDYTGRVVETVVEKELSEGLRGLSQRHGTTLYMTLLAGWAALLGRLSGQGEVVIGSPVANRGRAEIENLIGFFVNTLALRVDVAGKVTVKELLGRVKEQAVGAQRNQDMPFEQVVEMVQPERSLGHSPLFQVMFTLQSTPKEKFTMPGLEVRPLHLASQVTSKFDLTLSLQESGKRIVGSLGYASALFDRETVERYAGYLRRILEGMVADEGQRVGCLEMLPAEERRQLLYGWNETKTEYASQRCVHELFEEQVERNREAIALVYAGEEVSYGELNGRANRLAHYLREMGVRPEERVGICVERGVEMMVAVLGVLKAGGGYVPLDPGYPEERVRYMVEDSGPVVVLTERKRKEWFSGVGAGVKVVELDGERREWEEQPSSNPEVESVGVRPEDVAYVIYTSGSTGKPKGVMVEHGGVVNVIEASIGRFKLGSGSRVVQLASLSFDASVLEMWMGWGSGGKVYVPEREVVMSGGELGGYLEEKGISVMAIPPSLLETIPGGEYGRLETIVVGGETCSEELADRWSRGRALWNAYAPTEATIYATVMRYEGGEGGEGEKGEKGGKPGIGRGIANTQVYILDGEREPVPVGVVGEIYIGGAGVARGYLNRAELTGERFVPNPYIEDRYIEDGEEGGEGRRLYRSGDLGRWRKDGNIEFVGRNDEQVKIRGYRIELGEIEARLREEEGVREVVVVAREEEGGEKRLVAYYTEEEGRGGGGGRGEEMRGHLLEKLPEYMVPGAYVRMESLPLTRNGKIDRKGLPGPEGEAYAVGEYEAPEGEIESQLASIWAEMLKIDRVGRHDNFFALGGHSLLAVRVAARMRSCGFKAGVRALFAAPTVATLAPVIAMDVDACAIHVPPNRITFDSQVITPEMLPLVRLTGEEIERIVATVPGGAANVQDIYPLAPLQEGILFHHLMGGEGDPYLVTILYSFDTRERVESYLKAMQAVIDRHDILRTGVVWEGLSEAVQVVWRKAVLPVEEVDLGEGTGDGAERLYERFNPRSHRMDLRQAPLLRVVIAQDEEKERWLMLMLRHHLAGDHTALEVMQEEIQAYLQGKEEELAEPLPFRNLVAQARLGGKGEEQEEYFRKLLGDVEEPTAPFGMLDVRRDGRGIEEGKLKVEEELGRRMKERARKLGVSVASLCHVAWAQVLAKVSGREDVVFGSVLLGRMQGGEGADRVMGLFINTLPVRMRVGEEGVEASVREMHRQLAELLRHEHASLALAQRCSGVPAPQPLFTSLLNYRHSGGEKKAGGEGRGEKRRVWEGVRGLYGEERSNYPLILSVDDLGEGFGLTVQVEKTIAAKRVCGYMHTALGSLVEALEKKPSTAMWRLPVLPAEERQQVLYEWNGAVSSFPCERCVQEVFEEQASRTPQALAASFLGRQLSYEQLNRKANQWARFLRQQTGGGNVMVGVCLEPSLEMVIVLLAVLKAGGAYVPLDAGYPGERLAFMAHDAGIRVVVTERKMLERLPLSEVTVWCVDGPELEEGCERLSDSNLRVESDAASLAYVIYTSGSTGTPKGVGITHRGINRLVMNTDYVQLGPGDRVAQVSNLSFDALTFEVWGSLLTGAALVGIERDVTLVPQRFAQALEQQRITTMFVTTALFNHMAYLMPEAFSSLRELLFGGEAVDVKAVRRILSSGSAPRLLHVYGPTESTTFATWHRVEGVSEEADTVPIGRPINNTWIYVLDEYGQPAPVGVVGEIHIGGAGVGQGYLNRADLTAERFVPDPYIEDGKEGGGRMYRTGDLGRWRADHSIEFVRRNDHQVKIRGFRIELGEIEARLREHPGVREAVAMVREDTLRDKRLVVYYTSTKAESVKGAEELRTHLTARLPEYMVPAAYVRMEEMPLTQNGKLDRQALPEPESNAYGLQGYEPPQGGMEITMAGIWADVLKVERVGRNDNFFALGGHSLLVVKMVNLLKQAGIEISVSAVFEFPIIKAIAARIASCNAPASNDAAILIRESGAEPPLFLVHEGTGQLLYAHPLASCIDVEIPVYGLPAIATDEVQLQTVEQMAARMVRLIHSVQSVGPYRLAGWSFGGALAYEIAVQLIGAGHKVAFLGLLDTGYPPSINALPAGYTLHFDDKEKLLLFAQRTASENDMLQARFEMLRAGSSAMSFELLLQKCQELLVLPDNFAGKTAAQIRNWLARVHAIGLAYGRYSPAQLPVPVHLFRAQRETYTDPTLGWNVVIPADRLEIIPISGTHLSMMESPNIQILGQTLSRAIHNGVAARGAVLKEKHPAIQ